MRFLVGFCLLAMACAQARRSGPDGGAVDLAEPAPSPEPDLATPKLGFWMECTADQDCEGLCYRENEADTTGHCTNECDRLCPDRFECQTVRVGRVAEVDLCIPAKETLCNRCKLHRDCGDSADLCIEMSGEPFCTIDCYGNPG